MWQMKDSYKFLATSPTKRWSLIPIPLNLSGLYDWLAQYNMVDNLLYAGFQA